MSSRPALRPSLALAKAFSQAFNVTRRDSRNGTVDAIWVESSTNMLKVWG